MALPLAIDGTTARTGGGNWHCGPFKDSGGTFWVVLTDASADLRVYKATDPTTSWSQSGSTLTTTAAAAGAIMDASDDIHVVWHDDAGDVFYRKYDTGTEAWSGSTDTVYSDSIDAGFQGEGFVGIVKRSSDFVIIHPRGEDASMMGDHRVGYAYGTAGSWTTAVLDDGADHYMTLGIVLGTSDHAHLFYVRDPDGTAVHSIKTFDDTDTLSTVATQTLDMPWEPYGAYGATWDDAGTQRIRFPIIDNAGASRLARIAQLKENATTKNAEWETTKFVTYGDNAPGESTEDAGGLAVAYDADADALHALYVNFVSGSDADLYHDDNDGGSFGTDTKIRDGVVDGISANVYVRSGYYRLGMMYQDGTTTYYDEVQLGAAPTAATFFAPRRQLTTVRM